MLTVYIHGATATAQSFNYIRSSIKGPDLLLEYDSENGFQNNLDRMSETIAQHSDQALFFIGHSLGGIYALSLAEIFSQRTSGGVTISTPYGGSEVAPFLKYFVPFNRLLKEIGPTSPPIVHAAEIILSVPWCNLVTTRGNSPWISIPNDGVVTVESQRKHLGFDYINIAANHYEVLMDPETVFIVRARIKQAQSLSLTQLIQQVTEKSLQSVGLLDEDDRYHD
jgi:pimeloyl-ACP methyl ester carboxylesterase